MVDYLIAIVTAIISGLGIILAKNNYKEARKPIYKNIKGDDMNIKDKKRKNDDDDIMMRI